MKTIIIELPESLSSEGLADALAIIAHDAQRGAVDLSPNQYHYAVPMNLGGTPATATVRSAPTSTHPPLNTPLSAFTVEMLERLPVGSAFGPGTTSRIGGEVEKRADGWHYVNDGSWCVSFGETYDATRPLIRVGPEQASEAATEPAPLPDPWPGYLVEYDVGDGRWARSTIEDAYEVDPDVSPVEVAVYFNGANEDTVPTAWDTDTIREVRTPGGVTVWKRPAAKVTA